MTTWVGRALIKGRGLFKETFIEQHFDCTGDVKEVRIFGGHLGPHCWPKAIDMVAKKQLPIEDIITHTYPLEQFLEGIRMFLQSSKQQVF